MTVIRAGVIGLGVGERHAAAYAAIPGCRLEAVCDVDETRLREAGTRLGVGRCHADYRAITEDPSIDVVSICSYDDVHAEQAVSALRHGKHVMIEKPVAQTREEAGAVVAAWRASGRLITSNLILRRSPRFIEVKRRIDAGEMGDVYLLEGDYIHNVDHKLASGWRGRLRHYSPILGGAIHLIDLMWWLKGSRIVRVAALGTRKNADKTGFRFDDTDLVIMEFEDGALAKSLVTLTPHHPKYHALRVFGDQATFVNRIGDGDWYGGTEGEHHTPVTEAYPGMEKGDLLPDFIDAIRSGREPVVGAGDVFHIMNVCLAAEESRRAGRFVEVAG
jgi:predicted dehydrogenase